MWMRYHNHPSPAFLLWKRQQWYLWWLRLLVVHDNRKPTKRAFYCTSPEPEIGLYEKGAAFATPFSVRIFQYLMVQEPKGVLPLFDSRTAPPRAALGFSCTVSCFMVDVLPSCPVLPGAPFCPFLRMHSSSIS